ncbi:MAG: peptide deformylase [Rhodospirillaceae bacterium]|nr:peptide deformylase [Rhodospirillaceae bacterium]
MSILKIARMGHPVLRRRADTVEDPTSPEIQRLIVDMIETMEDAEGAGLAAPQVHVSLRLVVFHAPADVEGECPTMSVLINPVISPLDDEMEEGWEGCLSVPGLIGLAPRHRAIRYTALAPDGSTIDRTVEGFHARVVQHECDHLDGILYPQRMTDLGNLMFREEMRHYEQSADSEDEGEGEDIDEEMARAE